MHGRISIVVCALVVVAQERAAAGDRTPELGVGVSELLYQSSFFGRISTTVDATAGLPLAAWRAEAGLRLELTTGKPEAFGRFAIAPRRGRWLPSAGVELGVTSRATVGDDGGQLGDARMQANAGVSPLYAAFATQPLRFAIGERLILSALELQIGTQLSEPGRWTRVQIGVLAIGARL